MASMTSVSPKIDQAIKPGDLISATIRMAGNGGVTVDWNHAPMKATRDVPYNYVEHRPDAFGSIEEACHAICQACGGSSEYVDMPDADEDGE